MFRALQTMVIEVDGRPVELTRGERVELSEIEGTVLAASGYVERVDEQPADDATAYDSGDSGLADQRGEFDAQRPAQG